MIEQNLPWYRSRIIVAALISIVTKVLVGFGIVEELGPDAEDEIINTVLLVIGGAADLVAISSRVTQKRAPPITLRKDP